MTSDPDVVLTSLVTEKEESGVAGISVERFNLSGEPHAAVIVEAVAENYHRIAHRPTIIDLDLLYDEQVTLLRYTHGVMGHAQIAIQEGKLFRGSRGDAILPKGKRNKGFSLPLESVLDLEIGYNKGTLLRERVATVRAHFPETEKLTQADLDALPNRGNTCSLAVFASTPMPDGKMVGAVYLCHSYMRGEDDIVDNVLIAPDPWYSEHGSMYGKDLRRVGGKIVNFDPISFREAMDLTDRPYEEALDFLMAKADA